MDNTQIEQTEAVIERPRISVEGMRAVIEYSDGTKCLKGFGAQVDEWKKEKRVFEIEKWFESFNQVRERVLKGLVTVIRGPERTGKSEICEVLQKDSKIDLRSIQWQTFAFAKTPEEKCANIASIVFGKEEVNDVEGILKAIEESRQEAVKKGKIFAVALDEGQDFEVNGPKELAEAHRKIVEFLREEKIPLIDCLVDVPGCPPSYQDLYSPEETVSTKGNVV